MIARLPTACRLLTMSVQSAYVRLVMATMLWGGTFVAGRLLAGHVDPPLAAWLRFLLASLTLLIWLRVDHGHLPRINARQAVAVSLLGLSGIFAYNLLFFEGLETVEAGRAALIVALNPIVITLASAAWFGERLSLRQAMGALLSLGGALTVIARGDLVALLQQGVGRGELLLLGCVLSWVVYTLIGKRLLRRLPPLVAVTYASVAGCLLLGLFLLTDEHDTVALAEPVHWLSIGYLAFFGTVLGFVWYYQGVHAVGAARAAQFINLVPVSGVLLGVLLLNEPLTWSLLVGGLLVVSGLVLTNRRVVASG
jgi:drug/metabolite transporter (DMT)-like permease